MFLQAVCDHVHGGTALAQRTRHGTGNGRSNLRVAWMATAFSPGQLALQRVMAPASRMVVKGRIMKFGLFGSAAARRGSPEFDSSEGFRDFIDYNVEAEALGFHSTFVVEHHFRSEERRVGKECRSWCVCVECKKEEWS